MASKGSSNRSQIIESAKRLFAEKGFGAVSTREIAREANVATSALNYHFKNKESLFSELVEEYVKEQAANKPDILMDPVSAEDMRVKLELFANAHVQSLLRDVPLYRVVSHELSLRNPVLAALLSGPVQQFIEELTKFIYLSMKKGFLRKETDAKVFVMMLLTNIGNKVKYEGRCRHSLTDRAYRTKWLKSVLSIMLDGVTVNPNQNQGQNQGQT